MSKEGFLEYKEEYYEELKEAYVEEYEKYFNYFCMEEYNNHLSSMEDLK